jgi:hypothetical protein
MAATPRAAPGAIRDCSGNAMARGSPADGVSLSDPGDTIATETKM